MKHSNLETIERPRTGTGIRTGRPLPGAANFRSREYAERPKDLYKASQAFLDHTVYLPNWGRQQSAVAESYEKESERFRIAADTEIITISADDIAAGHFIILHPLKNDGPTYHGSVADTFQLQLQSFFRYVSDIASSNTDHTPDALLTPEQLDTLKTRITRLGRYLQESKTGTPTIRVLEKFEGFVDAIRDDVAYVTLESQGGEKFFGECAASDLEELGIHEHRHFVCETIERDGEVTVRYLATPSEPLSAETVSQIKKRVAAICEGNELDGDY